jgi:hypothetical protein
MRKSFEVLALATSAALLVGCGGSSSQPAAPSTAAPANGAAAEQAAAATKPDKDKLVSHLQNHVKYPVSREQLLAACADTPEFTAGEKKWLEQNLPEGNYASADAAISALEL